MNRLLAIIKNTFFQTVRQPTYGIIVVVTLGGLALAPSVTGWTLDDDNKMLRDIGLSTLLIQGLFLACFAASNVLNTEIEDKTVMTVAAKPVDRAVFLGGKYLGVLGGLAIAHYLAGVVFFMIVRHGVLQTAADKSDTTVLFFGVGGMLLVVTAAVFMNYTYDWRFLPTLLAFAFPMLTFAAAMLLLVDRDWNLRRNEITQTMDDLPAEAVHSDFNGIVTFRPLEGEGQIEGHRGLLVRDMWKGPITAEEREYLMGLSDSLRWKMDVDYLVIETRKDAQNIEILKAGLLIFGAVAILAGFAVAASSRFGTIPTFVICFLALALGLSADQVIKPLTDDSGLWSAVYGIVPNFQFFWMIDALSEDRVIPWSYFPHAIGYCVLYCAAAVLAGMALFETREVG